MNQINLQEINIGDKTDRLTVWKSIRFDFEKRRNEKRSCQFWATLLQPETKPYNPQTEKLWIYVNEPENKLKYIFKIKKMPFRPGQFLTNPKCDMGDCCGWSRKFNRREKIEEGKMYEYAYEITLIHEFKKGNGLPELNKYKHKDWPKRGCLYESSRKPTCYIGSYPDLVEDIKTGKVS